MATIADAAQNQGDVMRRLRDLERMVQEIAAGRRLENATIGRGGIRVDEEGLIYSTTFDGHPAAGDSGTMGWALGSDRLVLDGVFVNPLQSRSQSAVANNFTVGTADEVIVSMNMTPPTWAEAVTIFVQFAATARNNAAGTEIMWGRTNIGTTSSASMPCDRESGLLAHVSTSLTIYSYVIDEGSVPVEGRLQSSASFGAADGNNIAQLTALAIYQRFSSDV